MPRRAEPATEADGLTLCPLEVSGGMSGRVLQHPVRVVCALVCLCCEVVHSAKDNIMSFPMVASKGDGGLSHLGFQRRGWMLLHTRRIKGECETHGEI